MFQEIATEFFYEFQASMAKIPASGLHMGRFVLAASFICKHIQGLSLRYEYPIIHKNVQSFEMA